MIGRVHRRSRRPASSRLGSSLPGAAGRSRTKRWLLTACFLVPAVGALSGLAAAQTPLLTTCQDLKTNPPACDAKRGDRTEGWRPQTRSEVMARNGIVTTSQPLAAQAGLRIM